MPNPDKPRDTGKPDKLPSRGQGAQPANELKGEPREETHAAEEAAQRMKAAVADGAGAPPVDTREAPHQVVSSRDKRYLFGVLTLVLLAIGAYIAFISYQQFAKYSLDAQTVRSQFAEASVDQQKLYLKFIAATSGPQDVLVMRHITVFLGFVVIFIGAMLVLTGIQASYDLGIKRVKAATTLRTSSPGLVLITLGTVLILGALYRSVDVTFDPNDEGSASWHQLQDGTKNETRGVQKNDNVYDGPVVK